MFGKNRREKVRKIVFYIHTNIVTKKGGKTRVTIFLETHEQCEQKLWEKCSSGKRANKLFLYSHEYRDQLKRGGKRAKQVFQKHTNSASKKCGKKDRREKGRKNVFYIHTNIVTQKGGKNERNKISRNTRIVRVKNVGEKSSQRSEKNVF